MTLTIYLVDGNKYQFEGRDGEEVLRQIEETDWQDIRFQREKCLRMINRKYIVSVAVWAE